MQQQSGSEEERAVLAASVKQIFAKLEKLSKELDTLVIGVGLDPSSKALFLDFESRGVEGSDLAKKFAALKDAKTDFAGFALPGAALTMLSAGTSDDEDVADAKAMLANYKATVGKLWTTTRRWATSASWPRSCWAICWTLSRRPSS